MIKELSFQDRSEQTRRQDHRELASPSATERLGMALRPLFLLGQRSVPAHQVPTFGEALRASSRAISPPGQSGLGPGSAVMFGKPNMR